MKQSPTRKGQVFSTDFAASILVFSVLLTAFMFTWNMALSNPEDASEQQLRSESYRTTDILLQTEGNPSDWDSDPPQPAVIGLATEESYVLNQTKMNEFESDDFSNTDREELLGAPNFKLTIDSMEDGTNYLEVGNEPDNAETVIPITRYATVLDPSNPEDKEMVEVEYTVWE